jgi:hypothetical protein
MLKLPWTVWILAVSLLGSAEKEAELKLSLDKGQTLALQLTSSYSLTKARGAAPEESITYDYLIRLNVIEGATPAYRLRGVVEKASVRTDSNLLEKQPIAQPGPSEAQPDAVFTTIQRGIKMSVGAGLQDSSTDSRLGLFPESDPLSGAYTYLAIGFTEFPKGLIGKGKEWGEKKVNTEDTLIELSNKVTEIDGDIVTIETQLQSRVKDLSSFMKKHLESLPTSMLDYQLVGITRFNTKLGRAETVSIKASYAIALDGTKGAIRRYAQQEIQAKLSSP